MGALQAKDKMKMVDVLGAMRKEPLEKIPNAVALEKIQLESSVKSMLPVLKIVNVAYAVASYRVVPKFMVSFVALPTVNVALTAGVESVARQPDPNAVPIMVAVTFA